MTEIELHGCPHCTKEAYFGERGDTITFVACKNCGAQGSPVSGVGFDARQIAAEKWNTRGGLGHVRIALVDPKVPLETFKLVERLRDVTERIESGNLGEPECGAVLLFNRHRKSLTVSELRLGDNEFTGLVGALWSTVQAQQRMSVVK